MQGNAVHPGLQARFAMETTDAAKDFDEDILGHVSGVCGILQHARNDAIDWLVIGRDQPRKSLFRARLELRNNVRLFGPDCYNACQISHYCSCLHLGISSYSNK